MNIGIVGLGLMGGSLGRAAAKKTEHTVLGHDIDPAAIKKAMLVDAIHEPLTKDKVGELDILLLAVRPSLLEGLIADYAPLLKEGALVVDIAGNKREVLANMKRQSKQFPTLYFVSSHPMAGREFVGIQHASANLFDGASVLLVPATTRIQGLVAAKRFFLSLGFLDVVLTNEEIHDKMIAYTSQLPHILSASYIQNPLANEHVGFSAGSFQDLSRVAKMNVPMWTELTMQNRDHLLAAMDTFLDTFLSFQTALQTQDEAALFRLFTNGNQQKESALAATRQHKRRQL